MNKQKFLNLSALIIAFTAMSGSLYFSEVRGFIPCELCWYQRILMYPIFFILLIGIGRKVRDFYYYVLPLSVTGMLTSGYHYFLQKAPIDPEATFCTTGCTGQYINWFGFVTIPFLALTAFTLITIIMSILLINDKKANKK